MNTIGKSKGVWPTFVSFLGAHSFQGDEPGLVYCHALATWDELSPEKKRRLWASKLTLLLTPRWLNWNVTPSSNAAQMD
jgi:hypothetical protein